MATLTAAHRSKVIAIAQSQLGVAEKPAKSNRTPFGAWYGLDGNAWCAMFVSWVFFHAIGSSPFPATISKGFAYCPSGANWFKKQGLWASADAKPEPGWVVFFDFPGDGVGRISHVGIVTGVRPDGRIATVEGNTNGKGSRDGGSVMTHARSKAGGIVGYGIIRYGSGGGGGGGGAVDPDAMPVLRTTLSISNAANVAAHVEAMQRRLNKAIKKSNDPKKPKPLEVDGEFGELTEKAVIWHKKSANATLRALGKPPTFIEPINGNAGPRFFASLWFWTG